MEFKVLGPLRLVRPDGTEVNTVGIAQRRLISVLVLHAGTSVSADWLAELLEISSGALRTSVSRLRRVIGFDVLVTSPPGYSLKSDRVDAIRFERTVATTRAGGDPAVARQALEGALELWRGDAYAEFAHERWAMSESRRLGELRELAIGELIERLLTAEEWSPSIAWARALIEAEPFSDRPRGLLMRALAGDGRRADALRVFQEYRRLLIDEVGTEPSTDLILLDRSIAVHQAGAPSPTAPEPVRHNLPVPWSSFVGRDTERTTVVELIRTHRLVTMTGSGGCGKTRLALCAATDLVESHRGGTWWVELSPVRQGELVAERVAERVALDTGGTRLPGAEPVKQLVEHLTSLGRVLLILDNAEHVLEAVTELVHAVLSNCPSVAVLVTSRERLGLPAEVVWRVPSLSAPPDDPLSIGELEAFDAVRLFIERAMAAQPNLVIDELSAPALAAICRRLDGVPLALELAAARVASMPLGGVAAGLDDAFGVLGDGPLTLRARHQTLEASIAWSVDLLHDSERIVLGRLAVFRSSFSADAAAEVAAVEGAVSSAEVVVAMGHLVDKSLLQLDDLTGSYRLLEAVRQFCAQHLSSVAELEQVRGRHARYLARWCAEVGDGVHGIDRGPMIRAMPDVVAAVEWARQSSPADALRMCSGLGGVRSTLGHYSDLISTWDWLLAFDRNGELSAEWAAAVAALMAPATGAGIDVSSLVDDVSARLSPEDRRARGWLARGSAMVPGYQGDLAPLVGYAEGIVADQNDVELSIYAGLTAYLLALSGRTTEAERWVGEQRRVLRRERAEFTVDTVGNGYAAAILSAMLRGELDRAADLATGATPQDPGFSVTAAAALAQVAMFRGDRPLLDWAVRWSRRGTIPLLRSLEVLIEYYTRLSDGDVVGAADAAEQYRERAEMVPLLQVHQRAMLNLALLEVGRVDEVVIGLDEISVLAAGAADGPISAAVVLLARAQLDLCCGRSDAAIAAARSLIDVAIEHGFALMLIDALDMIAVGCFQRGQCDLAASLLGATAAERDRLGYRAVMVSPRSLYDDCLSSAKRPSEPGELRIAVQRAQCLR